MGTFVCMALQGIILFHHFSFFSLLFCSSPHSHLFQSCQPSWIFLHPFFHPVSAGPLSSSSLCIMWWHLFTTQASGCLLLCSVIWLLPFPEWGHSLGQQSMDRTRQHTCRKARDTSVRFYLNTHRPNDWPCVFSLVSSFSSHVCIKNRHIMDLSLSTTTQSRYRNILYVVIGTSLLGTSPESFIPLGTLFWLQVKSHNLAQPCHLILWRQRLRVLLLNTQVALILIQATSWSSRRCRRLSPGSLPAKSASFAETWACIYLYCIRCFTHTHYNYLHFHVSERK